MTIRELRKRSGMTQEELAKKMNVHQAAVSLWELGKSRPLRKYRKKLVRILGCTEEDLFKEG